ncbi:GNAT family N-acetyltransferase, partial [Marinobacter sp. Z-F4-2]
MMTLFQTNAWQSAWWETWGEENGLELLRGWHDGRTGIYTSTYPIKGVLPVRSIEFVGSSYRKIRTTRTEYGTFSKVGDAPAVSINELRKLMDSRLWSEAIFNDMRAESDEVTELLALAREKQWLVR